MGKTLEQVERMPFWEYLAWQRFFAEVHRQEQQLSGSLGKPEKVNLLAMTDDELTDTYGKHQNRRGPGIVRRS